MYSCFPFLFKQGSEINYYYHYYYYSYRPSARSLTTASPVFFLQSLMSRRSPPVFPNEQFDGIHPHFPFPTIPRLSSAASSSEIFFFQYSFRDSILSNILTTCPAHFNHLICRYPLLNKNHVPYI